MEKDLSGQIGSPSSFILPVLVLLSRCECSQDEQDHTSPQKADCSSSEHAPRWVDMLPPGFPVYRYKEDRDRDLCLFARKGQSREKQLWKVGP